MDKVVERPAEPQVLRGVRKLQAAAFGF